MHVSLSTYEMLMCWLTLLGGAIAKGQQVAKTVERHHVQRRTLLYQLPDVPDNSVLYSEGQCRLQPSIKRQCKVFLSPADACPACVCVSCLDDIQMFTCNVHVTRSLSLP
jgi:hypothetical protein